jgi:hypothetical protein
VRVPVEALLEIGEPALKPPVRLDQLAGPHEQGNRHLPVAVENRLRLGAFHGARVRRTQEGPCLPTGQGDLNAYQLGADRPKGVQRPARATEPKVGSSNLSRRTSISPTYVGHSAAAE